MDQLSGVSERLRWALSKTYELLEGRAPGVVRIALKTMRPRLERSLDTEDGARRAAALLTWAWVRIPDLLGDAVDLTDTDRVLAIARMVERREFGIGEPTPAPGHPGGQAAADDGVPV